MSATVTRKRKTQSHVENDCCSLQATFDKESMKRVKNAFHSAKKDDPILVIHWNPLWLAIPQNEVIREDVINHIITNHGTDREESGFIFHFKQFNQLIACRDTMEALIPVAFHYPPAIALRLGLPVPVEMAEAWIIIKTAVMSTDYNNDKKFFYKSS